MLNTAAAAADAFRLRSKFGPWKAIGVGAGPVIADLKSCLENILLWRKTVQDTRERWFGSESVAMSVVGDAAPRTTVRMSGVVELGEIQYIEEHIKLGLSC